MAERFSRQFLDDLLVRCDVVSVVGNHVKLERSGSNYKGLCPFHNEKTPSFYVYPDSGTYHCFGCNAHGSLINFLMEVENLQFRDAVESLARNAGIPLPKVSSQDDRRRTEEQERYDKLYAALDQVQNYYVDSLKKNQRALKYLEARGLDKKIISQFGIGYAPWVGLSQALEDIDEKVLVDVGVLARNDENETYMRIRDRVTFPIRDQRGRTMGFGGRVLNPDRVPKYINSPQTLVFSKRRNLYGLYEARQQRRLERLILVEGYMDVVALAQHGIHNAVASLGTAATKEQFDLLFRNAPEVVCCFDGDEAGRSAAWRALLVALGSIRENRRIRFLFLDEGEDPDSTVRRVGTEKFTRLLSDATPASDYFIHELTRDKDLSSVEAQMEMLENARPVLKEIRYELYQRVLVEKLAQSSGLGVDYLLEKITGRTDAVESTHRPVKVGDLHRGDRNLCKELIRNLELAKDFSAPKVEELSKWRETTLCFDMICRIRQYEINSLDSLISSYAGSPYANVMELLVQRKTELPRYSFDAFYGGVQSILTRLEKEERTKSMEHDNTEENLQKHYGGGN